MSNFFLLFARKYLSLFNTTKVTITCSWLGGWCSFCSRECPIASSSSQIISIVSDWIAVCHICCQVFKVYHRWCEWYWSAVWSRAQSIGYCEVGCEVAILQLYGGIALRYCHHQHFKNSCHEEWGIHNLLSWKMQYYRFWTEILYADSLFTVHLLEFTK